jgi:cytochrome c-type biogenesis protein CcmH/NrfG
MTDREAIRREERSGSVILDEAVEWVREVNERFTEAARKEKLRREARRAWLLAAGVWTFTVVLIVSLYLVLR